MTKPILLGAACAVLLAACAPKIPDSGARSPVPAASAAPIAADGADGAGDGTNPAASAPASISDEQDFAAVSERESIQSDAARIEANRARYEVIEPADLPARPDAGSQALVVEFALATTNPVGVQLYKRAGFSSAARAQRQCAKYARVDQAQAAFLARGGPKRDPMGLDPDGDGFACKWDPTPFRLARQGGEDLETAGPVNIDDTP